MRTRLAHAGVLLIAALLVAGGAHAQAPVTALVHATLIDGSGQAPLRDATIVIENGRIAGIGPGLATPPGARTVDLTGKFVTPGIINGHGHVGPAPRDPQLAQYARYGVTTTTSMYFDPDDIVAFKARQQAGDLQGARILTVKYRFMSPPFIPGSEVKTPEEARRKVDEIVATGADFVKVWIDAQGGRHPKLSREFCAAVLDQARKHNKITMAHIVELEDARMIVDEGVNVLVHDVRDQVIPDDFIAVLKSRKVAVIPTLAREEAMFVFGEGPGFTDNPFFQKGLTPERLALLKSKKRDEQASDPDRPKYLRMFDNDKINTKKLFDAGVPVGFGTDSGGDPNRYFLHGWFEHRQMELMVAVGLTPMQVIEAFSRVNSQILGIDRDFGTLAQGKAADLLVLGRNPIDDITNMRSIETVYLGGKPFE
jgi:imidazolonepropionase-like amidohydrolase